MVLAEALITTIDHRTAATVAASIHLHYEGSVVETPLAGFTGIDVDGVAVLAPEQGLVEWFPHDDQPLDALCTPAHTIVGGGLAVGVLVPAARMGEAHRALRGTPVTIQPWWIDGESIRFGGPEVP